MKKLSINQNTTEWLSFRKEKIGASDCAIIMGDSPYKTVFDLWKDKTVGVDSYQNEAMREGTLLEPLVLKMFNSQNNANYVPVCALGDDNDWMMASFDGYDEDLKSHIEIKVPHTKETFEKMADGDIPRYYIWQLQHQMAVSGFESTELVIFSKHRDTLVRRHVDRDPGMIISLLDKEEQFYRDYIAGFEVPEEDCFTREDEVWKELALEWKSTRDALRIYETREKLLKERMISISNGKSTKGCGVKLLRCWRAGSIDYTKVPELKGKDKFYMDQFRKQGTDYWRVF